MKNLKVLAFLISLGPFLQVMAGPNSMKCKTTQGPAATGTVCINSSNGKIPVRVSFRKMPTWGGHASFLLVDMCEIPSQNAGLDGKDDESTLILDKRPDDFEVDQETCIRRYCSEDQDSFGFSLNGIPIPLGYVTVRFWLGMEKSNFELRCKNVI